MPLTQVGMLWTDGSLVAAQAAKALTISGRADRAVAYLMSGVRCIKIDNEQPSAGMCSNGDIVINETFWQTSGVNHQSLMIHEVLHMGLGHHKRLGQRDMSTFNQATDAVINTIIEQGMNRAAVCWDRVTVPHHYTGDLVSEDIYTFLQAHPDEKRGDGGAGKGCGVKAVGAGEGAPSEGEQAPEPNAINATKLGEIARGMGGTMAKVFARLDKQPAVCPQWKRFLRKALTKLVATSSGNVHPSYSRVTKRNGLLLPKYRGSIPTAAIVVDTSGSMTEDAKNEITKQALAFSKEFPGIDILLVAHTDTVVYQDWAKAGSIKGMAEKACSFTGGTTFQPAYDAVAKACNGSVDLLVHFTDGEGESPWNRPNCKTFVFCDYGSGSYARPPQGTERIKMVL
jgi:predicted metal-dependent peptidase